jgi:hypothetical protein
VCNCNTESVETQLGVFNQGEKGEDGLIERCALTKLKLKTDWKKNQMDGRRSGGFFSLYVCKNNKFGWEFFFIFYLFRGDVVIVI